MHFYTALREDQTSFYWVTGISDFTPLPATKTCYILLYLHITCYM